MIAFCIAMKTAVGTRVTRVSCQLTVASQISAATGATMAAVRSSRAWATA